MGEFPEMKLAKTQLTKIRVTFNLPTSGNNVNPNFTGSSCNFACAERGGVKAGGAALRPTAEVCLHRLFAVTLFIEPGYIRMRGCSEGSTVVMVKLK